MALLDWVNAWQASRDSNTQRTFLIQAVNNSVALTHLGTDAQGRCVPMVTTQVFAEGKYACYVPGNMNSLSGSFDAQSPEGLAEGLTAAVARFRG
jgi:hypothetical protein